MPSQIPCVDRRKTAFKSEYKMSVKVRVLRETGPYKKETKSSAKLYVDELLLMVACLVLPRCTMHESAVLSGQ